MTEHTDPTATEFSDEFVTGMRRRMQVSFYKYGPVRDAYPNKVDAIASLKARLDRYAETGNTEWLMDVANFAMIEFMLPRHPQAHFRGTDAAESPGRVALNPIYDGEGVTYRNNDLAEADERLL